MPATFETKPAADFQDIPLETIIYTPLTSVVKAQLATSLATRDYIKSFLKDTAAPGAAPSYVPDTVEFKTKFSTTDPVANTATTKDVNVSVPLLAIVPIPHLRINSLKTSFKYTITQTVHETHQHNYTAELEAGASATLSWLVKASLKGSVSSTAGAESTQNRSGVLDVSVEASEAPMPEGLAKLLSMLSNTITVQ